jgi:ribosome-associated translation inhibitor RaiA
MSKIVIQSVQFKASRRLEEFVKEKVLKLFEQDPSVIRADVTLFEGASGNPKNQFCEIQLSVPGENHFVKKNSENYEKSVLEAVKTLQKVLRRHKTKKIIMRRTS